MAYVRKLLEGDATALSFPERTSTRTDKRLTTPANSIS